MKNIILSLLAITTIYSCKSQEENKQEQHLQIAEKYIEAVETNNVTLMDSLLADNYMGFGPSVSDSTNKKDAIANWTFIRENLYESVQYTNHTNAAITIKEGRTAGDWVINWAYLTIKYKDGRGPVHLWVNAAYKIENGKIVFSRTFYNEADVLRQLGYENLN